MKTYFEQGVRIALVITLIASAACDKKDESPIKKEELPGKWKLTALTVTAAGQTEDVFSDLDTWQQDDIYFYDGNGTYQIQEGATKDDPSDPDIIESGTWEINGKHLIMVAIGDDPETGDIILLNATTLKYSAKIAVYGVVSTVTGTYTKQP